MFSISEKAWAEQSSIKSVSGFYDRYKLGATLKKSGAYKQKGVPVSAIIQYLIALIYTVKSMFQDMRSDRPFAQGFSKDTVYRFMNLASVNRQAFLLSVASKAVSDIDRLTSAARHCTFVTDDTMFRIPYAKMTELVSKVFDHAEKGKNKYKWGFRLVGPMAYRSSLWRFGIWRLLMNKAGVVGVTQTSTNEAVPIMSVKKLFPKQPKSCSSS